jgi:hypothetical protein
MTFEKVTHIPVNLYPKAKYAIKWVEDPKHQGEWGWKWVELQETKRQVKPVEPGEQEEPPKRIPGQPKRYMYNDDPYAYPKHKGTIRGRRVG